MASTYKTPGVYVEEVSLFPPSIAQVETAVPAFIGYTKTHSRFGEDLLLKPTKIRSLAEYEESFGGAPPTTVKEVKLDGNNNVVETELANGFLLYDSLRLFFANGGSKCYIISIGAYKATTGDADVAEFESGLAKLEKEDEPTLILFPDAIFLGDAKLTGLQQQALKQSAKLGDRFAILDVFPNDKAGGVVTHDFVRKSAEFRNAIGVNNLKYGAAYGPYLLTNLEKKVTYRDVNQVLTRLGSKVEMRGLTAEKEVIDSIDYLEFAISDVKALNNLFPGGLAKVESDYLAAESAFKTLANDESKTITEIAASYGLLLAQSFATLKDPVNSLVVNNPIVFTEGVEDPKCPCSRCRRPACRDRLPTKRCPQKRSRFPGGSLPLRRHHPSFPGESRNQGDGSRGQCFGRGLHRYR